MTDTSNNVKVIPTMNPTNSIRNTYLYILYGERIPGQPWPPGEKRTLWTFGASLDEMLGFHLGKKPGTRKLNEGYHIQISPKSGTKESTDIEATKRLARWSADFWRKYKGGNYKTFMAIEQDERGYHIHILVDAINSKNSKRIRYRMEDVNNFWLGTKKLVGEEIPEPSKQTKHRADRKKNKHKAYSYFRTLDKKRTGWFLDESRNTEFQQNKKDLSESFEKLKAIRQEQAYCFSVFKEGSTADSLHKMADRGGIGTMLAVAVASQFVRDEDLGISRDQAGRRLEELKEQEAELKLEIERQKERQNELKDLELESRISPQLSYFGHSVIRLVKRDKADKKKILDAKPINLKPEDLPVTVRYLREQNCKGYEVFIQPQDRDRFLVLDDLSSEKVKALPKGAFIVETSRQNFTAVLKLDSEITHEQTKALQRFFGGDPACNVQSTRLVSFRNWKHTGKHFSQTKQSGTETFRLAELLEKSGFTPQAQRAEPVTLPARARKAVKPWQSFDTGDDSRTDFIFSLACLSAGLSPEETEEELESQSPVRRKGPDYFKRTVAKAIEAWRPAPAMAEPERKTFPSRMILSR